MSKILLVQPRFPLPAKSLNHKDYLPIGLLKLSTWHKEQGDEVQADFGVYRIREDWVPDTIYVTSLFTYWANAVREAVRFYRDAYGSGAEIVVGGIYASLEPVHCKQHTGCDRVHEGVHVQAEALSHTLAPDYGLLEPEPEFQIVHASRGCIRKCTFCGTHRIEEEFLPKASIMSELKKNHLVFYDNNLLANPYIGDIFEEIASTRMHGRVITCESQSGIDGRILRKEPHLAAAMKRARFKNVRIAWDAGLGERGRVAEQLQILEDAGFSRKEIQVFMIYNHDLDPEVMVEKAQQCFDWGVQVSDCRYRPLDAFSDGYRPMKKSQDRGEYHIHPNWSDADVRAFRRLVRENNICIRYGIPKDRYDQRLEGFSRHARVEIAEMLGIDGRLKHSDSELARINEEWLKSREVHG
ncbi:MAG TPA: Fe-S oxidoreductase [Coriobacteriia bacterium]|nr:Fe-S oxidoreductase [Coriobacteriia bacterium]